MSDILFRYLLAARRRDRSFLRRVLFADEQLLAAGVEQLVESAAARVAIKSQHERVSRRKMVRPASARERVRFYDVAQPDRPVPYHFDKRSEEFPLGDTLKVFTCPRCRGSGKLRCATCSGRGKVRCSRCGGSGRMLIDGRVRRCGTCRGARVRNCFRCGGDGRATCHRCRGEGQLASWEVEIYEWLIQQNLGEEYPLSEAPKPLRKAFERWLALEPKTDLVESLEPEAVALHLGYDSPEAREVAERADTLRRRLEDEARRSSDAYLFHRTDCTLTPAGYTVVRMRSRDARYYWLVGRGERAQEVRPRARFDGGKGLGWLGFGSGGVMTYDGIVEAFHLGLPEFFEHLLLLGDTPAGVLAGGAAASAAVALAGVRRVTRQKPFVKTVGLLPVTGEPTAWLTCLAYLGSYCDRLKVLDRAYDTQMQRLVGAPRPAHQSESLTVELADGRRLRLIEVARPLGLSDDQLRLMLEALDGALVLEESRRAVTQLEGRLLHLATQLPADERPLIGSVLVDRASTDLPDNPRPEGLAFEAIRRAFVDDLAAEVDWDALFRHIWIPLDELLAGRPPRLAAAAAVEHETLAGSRPVPPPPPPPPPPAAPSETPLAKGAESS